MTAQPTCFTSVNTSRSVPGPAGGRGLMHGSDWLGQGCSRVGLRSVLKQGMFMQRLSVIHIKMGLGAISSLVLTLPFWNSCLIVTPLCFARMLSVNTKCPDKKLHCVDTSLLRRGAFGKNVSTGQWRGVKRELGTRWSGASTPLEFTYFSLWQASGALDQLWCQRSLRSSGNSEFKSNTILSAW